MNKEILNGSGCKDLTAYEAIKNTEREERKKTDRRGTFNKISNDNF